MPAKAASRRSSFRANQTTSFFFVFGLASGAYSPDGTSHAFYAVDTVLAETGHSPFQNRPLIKNPSKVGQGRGSQSGGQFDTPRNLGGTLECLEQVYQGNAGWQVETLAGTAIAGDS
jgi:hypothetical protein